MKLLQVSLLLAICGSLAFSQGLQNAIQGEVTDSTGAAVAGAGVTVTNNATGVVRSVSTDSAGQYSAPSLVIGEYTVRVAQPGMKAAVRTNIVVQADKAARVDFQLEIGDMSQSVEVKADISDVLLRTEDAATGIVVSQLQAENLPLKGRNFATLAQMAPGANEAQPGNQNSLGRTQPLNLSANGQRQFDNNYRLDGVSMISGYINGSTFVPSLEALQEVSVQTGQYSASMGLYSGAQVDMVVKSGTNQVHGSAYEFLRNNKLNARQFFDVSAPPPFRFNQFGATIGGPLFVPKLYNGKNRTFFFFAYQGDRTRRLSTGQGTAASAAMRRGDFSELLPGKVIRDPYTKQPFPGNIIPADRLAPQAQKLLAYVPLPNLPGRALNFINTGSNSNDENQYFGRLDHHLSSKDTIFFRAAVRDSRFQNVTINPNFGSFGFPTNQNHALTETHIFSPRLINEVRASYVRESVPTQTGREGSEIDPIRDFGITGLNYADPLIRGIPSAGVSGYMGTGENFANPRLLFSNPAVQDNLMLQLSKHSLRMGFEYFRWRQDVYAVNATHQGQFSFSGLLSGDAFADFILGLPSSTTKSNFLDRISLHQKHGSAYLQDDWRVTSRLTLNLGLRYEFAGSYKDLLGNARNFDWKTLSLFPEPGATSALNDPSHNFAPRFGLAYRLRNSTVLRGGFGLFYTQPTVANVTLLYRNPPRNQQNTYNTNLDAPDLTLADGFRSANQAAGSTVPPDLVTIPRDYGPGYAETWTFNIQQSLPGGWVAEAGYVGSHTLHLDNAHTENVPLPGAGNVQARRPIQQWGNIRVFGTDGVACYNGLQTRLQSSYWHNLNFLGSYTYSRCIDTKSSAATSAVGSEDSEPQNQYDRFAAERGRCIIDFQHQFKVHSVYEIPVSTRVPSALGLVFRHWQISAGVTLHSGSPFTIITAGNSANTSRGTIRANRLADGNLPTDQQTPLRWFDTSAFAAPPLYTFGNSGRGIIEGPGTKLLDLSITRRFIVREGHTLQVRGDFFNTTNTPQFGNPGRTVGNADFGRISSTGPAREVQLGLRYAF